MQIGIGIGIPMSALAGGGAAFIPDSAFFAGSKGFAYDFSDATKLYQLSNGTTAVTADSDPIGYVTDLSGNAAHGTQATAGNRPIYKTGLPRALFNGTSQFLAATGVDLSGTDKVTVIVACNLLTTTNRGLVGHGNSAAGDFNLLYSSGSASWWASLHGSTGNAQVTIATADKPAVPHTQVFSVILDLAGATATDEIDWRMNGVSVAEEVAAAGPAGGGNFANRTSEVGRTHGAFFMDGSVYRIIVIGRELTTAELFNAEYWAGQAIGYTVIPEIPPAGQSALQMLDTYGQSLSCGATPPAVPISTTTRFAGDVMFTTNLKTTVVGFSFASLIPLVETTDTLSGIPCAETPIAGMSEMLHERSTYTGLTLGMATGFPSLTIAQCSIGQTAYNSRLTAIRAAYQRGREQSMQAKMLAFCWLQGESDGATATASYAATLNTLRTDINIDVKAITKQTDDLWCLSYQLDRAKIGLAHLLAQETYDNIVVAAPIYHLERNADGIHFTSLGSKIMGAYFGLAYERAVLGSDPTWKPLMCTGSSVAAQTIDLTYNKSGLVFDTTIVSAQTNQGFAVVDAGLTPLTVSSVTIVSGNIVRIVVASGTPATVYYGFDDPANHTSGIDKGNLRDAQGDTVVFDGDGLDYPMHNWAVLQSISL
ncbi:MAG: hypothetical protein KBF48_13735 [Xanthomonadales bacterium]|nr:hypothetical protein [Xanthomonadales bacterium]